MAQLVWGLCLYFCWYSHYGVNDCRLDKSEASIADFELNWDWFFYSYFYSLYYFVLGCIRYSSNCKLILYFQNQSYHLNFFYFVWLRLEYFVQIEAFAVLNLHPLLSADFELYWYLYEVFRMIFLRNNKWVQA